MPTKAKSKAKSKKLLQISKNHIYGDGYDIYQGDCVEILNQLPGKSVDLIFADPPYNLQLKNELYRPNQSKVDGVDDDWDKFSSNAAYDKFTEEWLTACRRVMADNSTIWVIGSYHNIFRVGRIMMDLGFWILNDVQWYKSNPMPNFRGVRFTNATETMIWAKKSEKQKKYTFNHKVMKQLNGGKQMTSVWNIPLCTGKERIKNKSGKKAHSTQKPEEILRRVISASSSQNDMVLDPFAGSGTTCAVAKKLLRKSIGIEKEKKYLKIIEKRLQDIDPDDFGKLRIDEPKKEKLTKVTIQDLIQSSYIKEEQELYSKNQKHSVVVMPDGRVKNGKGIGSIHQIGAKIRDTESCNGWTFWYAKDDNGLTSINEYRQIYRNKNGIRNI